MVFGTAEGRYRGALPVEVNVDFDGENVGLVRLQPGNLVLGDLDGDGIALGFGVRKMNVDDIHRLDNAGRAVEKLALFIAQGHD